MKRLLKITLFLSLIIVLFFANSYGAVPVKVVALKCEYLNDPIGIDAPNPRLTWQLADNRQGAKQTAYQIIVGTDSLAVTKGQGSSWQTENVNSAANLITYAGSALQPYTRYYWSVTLWDKDGKKTTTSAIASFETGLMGMKNWKGFWISDDHDINTKPAAYFRKTFETGKKIRSARAYIAVAGLYELYINGKKIGDHRLDPMYTRFDRRNLYVSYDVTNKLQNGKNAIGVI
jgi:alpha-L-rhamnosidase